MMSKKQEIATLQSKVAALESQVARLQVAIPILCDGIDHLLGAFVAAADYPRDMNENLKIFVARGRQGAGAMQPPSPEADHE